MKIFGADVAAVSSGMWSSHDTKVAESLPAMQPVYSSGYCSLQFIQQYTVKFI